jgi:hypothetical protein
MAQVGTGTNSTESRIAQEVVWNEDQPFPVTLEKPDETEARFQADDFGKLYVNPELKAVLDRIDLSLRRLVFGMSLHLKEDLEKIVPE